MKILHPHIPLKFNLSPPHSPFEEALQRILHTVLSQHGGGEDRFFDKLPMVCWTPLTAPPVELSFFLWCRLRPNVFHFFYEMVTRWLIPGKRLHALLQFAVDFSLPEWGGQHYIGGEVRVRIENPRELEILQKNLPTVENEIRLGVDSYYQACRILEIKGFACDEKTALIQENIVALIKHRPQDFDYDILSEMQHFLVLCKEEFKQARSWRHMSRIICVHYLFRKSLQLSLEVVPERRYINIKLIRASVMGDKRILGIAIGLSFLKEHEKFEAQHILNGVQAVIPKAKQIKDSFFCNQSRSDPTLTYYIEIEAEGGTPISLEEERLLKAELPGELKNSIEQRLNPIFMPHNEEIIMRHILTLSSQIKYVRDLPQVIIDFVQQTEEKLEFLVVVLRVMKNRLKSISASFESKPTYLEYFSDRSKIVGWVRKKYKKEATVFRLRIHKLPFLRKDHSVDLNKARQAVSQELQRIMGDFRDYNGGMISKENELFEKLNKQTGDNLFLLENFFYSLHPPVMRSLLPLETLNKLFNMIQENEREGLAEDLHYQISMHYDAHYLYLVVMAGDWNFREPFLLHLSPYSGKIATCFIKQTELPCFGLIVRGPDEEEALHLRLSIEQILSNLYKKH